MTRQGPSRRANEARSKTRRSISPGASWRGRSRTGSPPSSEATTILIVPPAAPRRRTSIITHGVKAVYLFVGGEGQLKEKAIGDLKRSLLESSAADLNYNVFYGNDAVAKEILDCATTMPFSGRKRIVVVKRAERLKEEDRRLLAGYIASPQDTTCLVIDTEDAAFLDGITPGENRVEVVSFDRIPEGRLAGWIVEYFRSHGKTAGEDAVEILKELFGQGEHGILERELEKLLAFTGDRTSVTADDVEEVAGKGLFDSTLDLTDAISRQDAPGALKVLRGLFASSVPRYADIVGLLSWHLRTLLKGRILWEGGRGEFVTVSALKVPKRLRHSFLAQVKRMSAGALSSKLDTLLDADLDSKTGRMDPKVALEAVVVKLCLGERG